MNAVAKMPRTAKERGKVAPAKLAHVVLRTPPERAKMLLDWYKVVLEGAAIIAVGGDNGVCPFPQFMACRKLVLLVRRW